MALASTSSRRDGRILAADPPMRRSDKRAIKTLLWALKPLANLRNSIPLPYVIVFLMVAIDEGKGVNAYARAVGMERRLLSRYLRGIGSQARNGGPGLGLVTVEPHPAHRRRRQVILTAKGRSIAIEIFRQMRRASSDDAENDPERSSEFGRNPLRRSNDRLFDAAV